MIQVHPNPLLLEIHSCFAPLTSMASQHHPFRTSLATILLPYFPIRWLAQQLLPIWMDIPVMPCRFGLHRHLRGCILHLQAWLYLQSKTLILDCNGIPAVTILCTVHYISAIIYIIILTTIICRGLVPRECPHLLPHCMGKCQL